MSSARAPPTAAVHGRCWMTRLQRYAVVSRSGLGGRCRTSFFNGPTKKPAMSTMTARGSPTVSGASLRPKPTRATATSPAAMRPRQRVRSTCSPAKPSSAGSNVSDAATVTATTAAAPTARPCTKLDAHEQHAEQRDDDGDPGEQDRPSRGVEGDGDRLAHRVTGVQLLAVAGDDQERVVDADAEPDHDAEEGGEVGDRHHVAQQGDEGGADADAEEGDADGQPHGQHRAEGDDEDDDGEGEAEGLGRRLLELGEDEAAQLDVEALDVRRVLEDLVADLPGAREVDVLGQLDVGERDQAGLGALRADLLGTLLGIGALDPRHVVEGGDLGEQRLHRFAHGRVVDPLLGAEHDRAHLAGALAAELRVEDVEPALRLDVGQVELVAEAVADGPGDDVREHRARRSTGRLRACAGRGTRDRGVRTRATSEIVGGSASERSDEPATRESSVDL